MEKHELGKGKGSKLRQLLMKFMRCRSFTRNKKALGIPFIPLSKCRSWPSSADSKEDPTHLKSRVAPQGCFSVYVGPEKVRFVIKTEYANHPLFKMLLEEAEMEYGYNSNGPLALPCEVDLFQKILCEMDSGEITRGCSFAKGYSPYHLLTTPSHSAMN